MKVLIILVALSSVASAADPIVGNWSIDKKFGRYVDVFTFDADGTFVRNLKRDASDGTWEQKQEAGGTIYKLSTQHEHEHLAVIGGRVWTFDENGPIRSYSRTSKRAVAKAAAPNAPAPKPIDVLAGIDLKRDVVSGEWSIVDGKLHTGVAFSSIVELPVQPPLEYCLEITAARKIKKGPLVVGLVVGNARCYAVVNAPQTGIGMIDGKFANDNESASGLLIFRGETPLTIRFVVSRDGISIEEGGKKHVNWAGNPGRLSLDGSGYHSRNDGVLFIGGNGGDIEISSIKLSPIRSAK